MNVLIIFALIINFSYASAIIFVPEVTIEEWEAFVALYNKSYSSALEENLRYTIYVQNKLIITAYNLLYQSNLISYTVGINQFADMTHLEFMQTTGGFDTSIPRNRNLTRSLKDYISIQNTSSSNNDASLITPRALNSTVDWRTRGAVSSVRNQGGCSSCYSFSAIGAIEAQTFRKTRKLFSISSQNIVDCSHNQGNNGCYGGWMTNVYQYVQNNKGVDTENVYPYEAISGTCRYMKGTAANTTRGFVNLPSGDENILMKAVFSIGPIAVGIDTSQDSFHFYKDGIYYDANCSNESLTHGVLVVGYGQIGNNNNQQYWIVKNSWGTSWGQQGYIFMARNKSNNCGIATAASYPVL